MAVADRRLGGGTGRTTDDLRRAEQRVDLLEERMSEADYYLSNAMKCRSDTDIRDAIMRIAHETLKDALARSSRRHN